MLKLQSPPWLVFTFLEPGKEALLTQRVHPDECHWSMSTEGDEKKVTVTLTKAGDKRWSSLLSA